MRLWRLGGSFAGLDGGWNAATRIPHPQKHTGCSEYFAGLEGGWNAAGGPARQPPSGWGRTACSPNRGNFPEYRGGPICSSTRAGPGGGSPVIAEEAAIAIPLPSPPPCRRGTAPGNMPPGAVQ